MTFSAAKNRKVSFAIGAESLSGETVSLLSPNSEFKFGHNTQIYVTPPPSSHNTIHSLKELSNPPPISKSKDDNSDIERKRKSSSSVAGKFWFLKPGNLLTGASGSTYNPYHTIGATPSNTFKTSPSTARLNHLEVNVESNKNTNKRNKKQFVTTQSDPLNSQATQRKSRIRTTSLCDPLHNTQQLEFNNKKTTNQNCDPKKLEVDHIRNSPKTKRNPELPSNFETSEAVLRLQELFSATHSTQYSTNSNNSSIASGEVPAGVAYAESCIEAFGFATSVASRSNSRHQSPLSLAPNELNKITSKHSSHSTLVQSNSTPHLSDVKDPMQEKDQRQSPSNSPIPDSNTANQVLMKKKVLNKMIYRKQSSPSPQRHENLRLSTLLESHMTKSKSTTNFFQSQNSSHSPTNDRAQVSKDVINETILEDDNRNMNERSKTTLKKVNWHHQDNIDSEDKDDDNASFFKVIAVPSSHVRERKNMLYNFHETDTSNGEYNYESFQILDPKYSNLFEHIKGMYANWLYNSRLYIKHCEILNKIDPYCGSNESDNMQSFDMKRSDIVNEDCIYGKTGNSYTENLQVECNYLGSINTSCGFCGECYNLESQCTGCRKPSIYCSICRMPVFGLASTCLVCNHGGHTLHIQQWFQDWYISSATRFFRYFCKSI